MDLMNDLLPIQIIIHYNNIIKHFQMGSKTPIPLSDQRPPTYYTQTRDTELAGSSSRQLNVSSPLVHR